MTFFRIQKCAAFAFRRTSGISSSSCSRALTLLPQRCRQELHCLFSSYTRNDFSNGNTILPHKKLWTNSGTTAAAAIINSYDATARMKMAFRRYSSAHVSSSRSSRSQSLLLYLLAFVFAMVGLTYAAVPLYRKFCQATGYGGTVQRRETVEEKIARHAQEGTKASREITIYFISNVSDGMHWKFVPSQREVKVKPGESALAFFMAENLSSKAITGVSTYNVTPMKAAIYFNKIQCFCFEEQKLLPGEKIDMPVFFYVDPEFETDPKMKGIDNIVLSYTFFKVEEGD